MVITMLQLEQNRDYCFDNADIMLVNSGILLARPVHCHTFYEFFVVESGNAIHTVNDRSYVIEKGDLILIRPRDMHSYSLYESQDFHVINVPLSVKDMEETVAFFHTDLSCILDAALPKTVRLGSSKLNHLTKRLHGICEMPATPIRGAHLRSVTFDVLLELLTTEPTSDELPRWMRETICLLEKSIDHPEEFEAILAGSGKTKEHVCRTFKRYLHTTPTRYCSVLKLRRAGELLRTTDASIQDICRQVGFNRKNYFYKCFEAYYHMTPLEYRRIAE